MKRRILSIILAAVMLTSGFAMVSCDLENIDVDAIIDGLVANGMLQESDVETLEDILAGTGEWQTGTNGNDKWEDKWEDKWTDDRPDDVTDERTDDVIHITDPWYTDPEEPSFPNDMDFQGVEIGIAVRPEERYRREFSLEQQYNPLDMRITMRNAMVERTLGVKLNIIGEDAMWGGAMSNLSLVDYVKAEYVAGAQSEVNVVAAYGAYATSNQLYGYYVNLIDNEKLPYLDTTKYYWNQSYVDEATCYDQLYTIVGDLNLTIYDKAHVVFTNMSLAESNGIDPDYIYTAVENYGWTYQTFFDLVNDFEYIDSDNDKTVNVGDVVPLTSIKSSEAYDGFYRGWNMKLLYTNDDGSHSTNVDGNTRLENGVEKMRALYNLDGVLLTDILSSFDDTFVGGNALFCIDILYRNATFNQILRNADFTYAILPLPMYDEGQKEVGYMTGSQDSYNAMSVMDHRPEELEAVSATLELLSAYSHEDVIPFYIEMMVQSSYASGAKQIAMLELVLEGVAFDTETIYSLQIGHLSYSMWRSVIQKESSDVTAEWASKSESIENHIHDFDLWFRAIS